MLYTKTPATKGDFSMLALTESVTWIPTGAIVPNNL